MPTVLITGGTGLIGKALSAMLVNKGYEVIILSRSSAKKQNNSSSISYAKWNIEQQTMDRDAVAKADYIIHLAGANVAEKRWTAKRKKEIVESRTKSSALLIKYLNETPNKVKALISASAIGWYGENLSKEKAFKEDAPAANDFLGQTCKQWEQSIQPVAALQKRLVILRTGIVISHDGGALMEFKKPLQFGIAAILSSGEQIISWIHIEDLCRIYLFAIEHNIAGIFNAVAPKPVSNKTLTLTLAKDIRGRTFIPIHVPSFVLKIVLGEMSIEVLKSATVSAEKIRQQGFQFLFPSIEAALEEIKTNIPGK